VIEAVLADSQPQQVRAPQEFSIALQTGERRSIGFLPSSIHLLKLVLE